MTSPSFTDAELAVLEEIISSHAGWMERWSELPDGAKKRSVLSSAHKKIVACMKSAGLKSPEPSQKTKEKK